MREKIEFGLTLIELLIIVAIISLLASMTIPYLLRTKITANDAIARNSLSSLSSATEIYYASESGAYPASMADLTSSTPPYMNVDYCDTTSHGFSYACTNSRTDYTYAATPTFIGLTGTTVYTISTGGILTP